MSVLALLLAAASTSAPAPTCVTGAAAEQVLKPTREGARPLGLVIGLGGDWASRYLVLTTTHRLAFPGIDTARGSEAATYYATMRGTTCFQEITLDSCPSLRPEIEAYRARAYPVMFNRTALREGSVSHPTFAVLRAQDGDGNTTNTSVGWHGHPLINDAAHTFRAISACTQGVDQAAGMP